MHIKFVGTGGAFDFEKGTAAAIVEHDGTKVLIDCGFSTLPRLVALDLVKEIDYVLITHLHGDHIGSFPSFLAYAEFRVGKEIPIIYPTETLKDDVHELLRITFEEKRGHYVPMTDFPWIGFVDTFGQHVANKQSFAYYFTDGDDLLYYSGDLGNVDTTLQFLKSRSEKNIKVFHDINKKDLASHVYYQTAQAKLMDYEAYGYHCTKADMPDDCTITLVEEVSELNY